MSNRVLKVIRKTVARKNFRQTAYAGLWRMNDAIRPDHPPYPIGASIGITDRCNLKCIMCSRLDPNARLGELTFEQFQHIVGQITGVYSVMLTGRGEPLLHEDLYRMIEHLHRRGIAVGVFTNATLLTADVTERLLALGLEDIRFSVDGATKGTFESIRVGASFKAVTENISLFMQAAQAKGGGTTAGIRVTAMKDNLHELPALVQLASELGVGNLQIGVLSELFPHLKGRSVRDTEEEMQKVFNDVLRKASDDGIDVHLQGMRLGSTRLTCRQPHAGMRITTGGVVNPCCGSVREFGNIFQESLHHIWHSQQFVGFRKDVRSQHPPPECLTCPASSWE